MKLSSTRQALLVLAVALCAIASGCTGSEQIVSAYGTVVVRLVGEPSTSDRYDHVTLRLESVLVRPEDPELEQRLGNGTISLFSGPSAFVGDLAEGAADGPASALTAGRYRVIGASFGTPSLTDVDVAPGGSCIDSLQSLPGETGAPYVPSVFALNESDVDLTFDVPAAGTGVVTVSVDVPALIEAYESTFTCSTVNCPGDAPACIVGFDAATFTQQLPQIFSIL